MKQPKNTEKYVTVTNITDVGKRNEFYVRCRDNHKKYPTVIVDGAPSLLLDSADACKEEFDLIKEFAEIDYDSPILQKFNAEVLDKMYDMISRCNFDELEELYDGITRRTVGELLKDFKQATLSAMSIGDDFSAIVLSITDNNNDIYTFCM